MAKKKKRSREPKVKSPAKTAFDQAGYTHFGAFALLDPHLKKWRVVMMATAKDRIMRLQIAPDVFDSEGIAKLHAVAVQKVFTGDGSS